MEEGSREMKGRGKVHIEEEENGKGYQYGYIGA
jgi:hypothetical protein